MTDEVIATTETKAPKAKVSDVSKISALSLKVAKLVGKSNLSEEDTETLRKAATLLYSTANHAEALSEHSAVEVSEAE